jgi:serine/threonine-protein kinase
MARRKPAPVPSLACVRCGQLVDPSRGAVNFCPACGASQAPGGRGARRRGREQEGVVAERYRLLELLGEGGMGRVYRAEHIRMGKVLALKLLREDFAREPAAAERFVAEARAVSRLSHPHSIAVFDFGEVGSRGGLYLAMEYVPGENLAAALRARGTFPEARARAVGRQILGSLAEAHEAGVVHRDVKPGNLMLMRTRTGEDFVKVLDFGMAALRDEVRGGGAETIMGTPAYLAPEQARGADVDGRADLYALGCVLYELVAGRPPFVAPSPMAIVSAHLSQEPPPLSSLAPGVSRGFSDVVHRALAKRPVDRFSSADAMRDALLATAAPGGRRARPSRPAVERDGDLGIASRADFEGLRVHLRRLGAGRVASLVLAALVGAGALAWRWDVASHLIVARAPALAAMLPEALEPGSRVVGGAPEPDHPEPASPLPAAMAGEPARVEEPEDHRRSDVRLAGVQAENEAGVVPGRSAGDPVAEGVGAAAHEEETPGAGTLTEEDALSAIGFAPCSAEEVWARAEAFLARTPAPAQERAAAARVLAARAAEELAGASPDDLALRARAEAAWRAVAAAGGAEAAAAEARATALAEGEPLAAGAAACP